MIDCVVYGKSINMSNQDLYDAFLLTRAIDAYIAIISTPLSFILGSSQRRNAIRSFLKCKYARILTWITWLLKYAREVTNWNLDMERVVLDWCRINLVLNWSAQRVAHFWCLACPTLLLFLTSPFPIFNLLTLWYLSFLTYFKRLIICYF